MVPSVQVGKDVVSRNDLFLLQSSSGHMKMCVNEQCEVGKGVETWGNYHVKDCENKHVKMIVVPYLSYLKS